MTERNHNSERGADKGPPDELVAAIDAKIKLVRERSSLRQTELAREARLKASSARARALQSGLAIEGSVADSIRQIEEDCWRARVVVANEAELEVQALLIERGRVIGQASPHPTDAPAQRNKGGRLAIACEDALDPNELPVLAVVTAPAAAIEDDDKRVPDQNQRDPSSPPKRRPGRPGEIPWELIKPKVHEWFVAQPNPPRTKDVTLQIISVGKELGSSIIYDTAEAKASPWRREWISAP
jgi:hypothetical protein